MRGTQHRGGGSRACLLLFMLLVVFAAGTGGAAAKGRGQTSLAAGYGSVWIGMGNGDVLALPPSLAGVKRALAGGPLTFVHGLTARYGALWVLRDQVTRLDPVRGVGRDVPETTTGSGIAAGAGAIWGHRRRLERDPPDRPRAHACAGAHPCARARLGTRRRLAHRDRRFGADNGSCYRPPGCPASPPPRSGIEPSLTAARPGWL